MSLPSPSTQSVQTFVFGQGDGSASYPYTGLIDDDIHLEFDEKRQSMYIEVLDEMLAAILKHESHLLHSSELDFIRRLNLLPYPARYLFIRLCLRKPGKWHRLSTLRYQHELGENIKVALDTLCAAANQHPSKEPVIKHEEREIIDLTLDDIQSQDAMGHPAALPPYHNAEAGPSSIKIEDIKIEDALQQSCEDLSFFARDHSHAELTELLECLTLDELKQLAKDMKIKKTSWNRAAIESALIKQASSQSILLFHHVHQEARAGKQSASQTQLPFVKKSQCDRLRQMVMKVLGTCTRINDSVFALLRRLNLVYFRCTQYTPAILTPSILSSAHRRAFQPYSFTRSSNIWPTRTALLAYERALELEGQIDALSDSTLTPSRARSRSRSVASHLSSQPTVKGEGGVTRESELGEGSIVKESLRVQNARLVLTIFETAYAEWKTLGEGNSCPRPRGLERFDRGHVLTRIVQKGAEALGVLKDYDRELEVLEALLNQRRWRRGRRGKWYERRALVLTRYGDKSPETLRCAMRGLIDSLNDPDTHLGGRISFSLQQLQLIITRSVYRPSLSRRLTALEKKMGISPEERHEEDPLAVSKDVHITGVRLRNPAATQTIQRPSLNTPTKLKQSVLSFTVVKTIVKIKKEVKLVSSSQRDSEKGKSTWQGQGDEVVNVETYALQHYERLGYRGYHCEGRIITTLFGLLFWDIIFAPIPGAFETPYQTSPLDIFEDTFYLSREELIEARLDEIGEGKARIIIEGVDNEHRERGTWCLGVRWDLFPRQDLLEIAECFSGEALACLCRVLCEDYAQRGSGVPDLFLWNFSEKHCKFVEVKGPGDKLQENQKLWIDVMQRAEVTVEVCYVEELGEPSKKQRTTIKKRPTRSKPKPNWKKAKQVDSDWETPTSEWEEEDELDASQNLQEDDLTLALVKKRSAEDNSPGIDSENGPAAKRLRTDHPEIG
ncbi:VRR-NUC domain-containing protein [Lactarius psammicola]|nr:VRR-NUC domain-containing protein [Lactarius psammicola]